MKENCYQEKLAMLRRLH